MQLDMSPTPVFRRPVLRDPQTGLPRDAIKTVPELIDFHARENPDYVFCMQSDSSKDGSEEEFHNVTYSTLENAVRACQASILSTIGETHLAKRDDQGNPIKRAPIALLMESDLSILLYLLSMLGLGIPVVLLSIRLSPIAIKSLVAATGADIIYTSSRCKTLADEAQTLLEQEQYKLEIHLRPSYKSFLNSPVRIPSRVYTDSHCLRDDDRNVFIMHSSGTTGLPKPIRQSHAYFLNYLRCHDFSEAEACRLNLTSLPLFHGFGLLAPLLSMSTGKTLVIPSSTLQTGAQVAPLLKQFTLGSFMTVPIILQELLELDNPEIITAIRKLDFVACAGGVLKEAIGDRLAAMGVKIVNSFGTTETGPLSLMYVPKANHDWRWFTLLTNIGINIVPENSPAETVQNNRFKLSVRPPGWKHVFEMQDAFAINPSDPTQRQCRPLERTDDVIVLENGEKVLPYALESILAEHENTRGAVVFGNGQSQLGVLVEPSQPFASPDELVVFKDGILRSLAEGGNTIDAHARILLREAIVVVPDGQALPRSDKGALLRRASHEAFAAEIEHAYELLSGTSVETGANIFDGDVENNLFKVIRTRILRPGQSQELTPSTDLFEFGLDSLQAMQLRQILFSSAAAKLGDREGAEEKVPRSFVYTNSTVSKMAGRLMGKSAPQDLRSRDEAIQQYVHEYAIASPSPDPRPAEGAVVLLTGASGGLGSHLLAGLVQNPTVKQVICLNRPSSTYPDPYARQLDCNAEKGADIPTNLHSKIEVIDTSLALPHLGLNDAVYRRLTDSVTHIVHNAWPMDFARQLASFRPQFQAVSNLLQFSLDAKTLQSSHGPRISPVSLLFTSSISVVGLHNDAERPVIVPECPALTAQHTLPLGYAEAKLVCENVLLNATQAGIVKGTIVRMGQISGAMSNGYWNPSEHVPTMVKMSVQVGALPQMHGTLSWLPLEYTARTLTQILFTPSNSQIYHLENPHRQTWASVLTPLSQRLALPFVPYVEWVNSLRNMVHSPDSNEQNIDGKGISNETGDAGAYHLVEFFKESFQHTAEGSVVLSMDDTLRVAKDLDDVGPVGVDAVGKFVEFWRGRGLF